MILNLIEWLFGIFQSADFMPHGHCYYWNPGMVWSHAVADSTIAAAYFVIPLVLLRIFRQRSATQYSWVTALFALFITGCGLTHVMDVITIWNPLYRLDAAFRILTALASVGTAIALVKIAPRLLAIPTEATWQRKNEELMAANEILRVTIMELAERKHFIEQVILATPDTVFVMNLADLRPTYTNRDFADVLGYSPEVYDGMDREKRKRLIHPDDGVMRDEFYQRFAQLADNDVQEVTYRGRHADDTYHHFRVRGSVFSRTPNGIPEQIIGIIHDITSLKETENALRQALLQVQTTNGEIKANSEELLALNETLTERNHFIELVTNTTPNTIYVFDLHLLKTVYHNKDAFQAIGYRTEEIYAMGTEAVKKLVHPEDIEKRFDYYRNFVTAPDQEIREVEFRIRHADGNYHWFLLRSTVFRRNAEGVPDQVISISQDITALKEAEAELRETVSQLNASQEEIQIANEELLATNEALTQVNETLAERNHFIEKVTETIPNTIFVFDLASFQAVYVSKDIFQTLGYSREELLAMGAEAMKKMAHPEDFERRNDFYRNFVAASDQEIREIEYRTRHADGNYRWLLVRGTVFRKNARGIPDQMIGITQDITALKETENSLRQALLQVQTTNEELNAANEEIHAANEEMNAANEELLSLNETLTERNHFIEKVTETTPNTIYVFDLPSFQAVYVSKDIFQTLGYSRQELLALGSEAIKKLAYPEDFERRNAFYRDFVTAGDQEIREMEYRIRHADGNYRWLLVRGTVFRKNAQGIPDQIIGSSQDITDLKKTEAELREALSQLNASQNELQTTNEELLSTSEAMAQVNETLTERNHFIEKVTDTTPNSIYIFDLRLFRTIYTNRDVIQTMGYTQEALYAKGAEALRQLFHPDDFERRNQYYRDFSQASDQEVREIEFRVKHADGRYRHLLIRSVVFQRDADGIPSQIIGISQDITQLKEIEADLRNTLARLTETNEEVLQTQEMLLQVNERLKEGEEKARLLTEVVQDYAILMLTPGGHVASWNEGAQRIKGYRAEEIIGKHFSIFYPPEAIEKQYPEYELKKVREEGRFEDEGWRIRKDGSAFWSNVIITALYNSRKELVGYSKIARDLTQKVKNEELTRKNQALMAINADLDNFVYTASHDLKHPVINMEGVLGVLQSQLQEKLTDSDQRWLDMMGASILRLKSTIKHLTEISRIQKGIEEAAEEMDLEQLTEEIKQDFTQLMEQNQAVVHTDFQIRHVRYSPQNLRSILSNLLSNAIKYRHPQRNAEVWLSTRAEGQWTMLSVRDSGLGLSEEDQAKLFKMFKRLHDHVEGTGIGLYMIKRIVENNGGKIVVDSQLGVGSTFTVYFTPQQIPSYETVE